MSVEIPGPDAITADWVRRAVAESGLDMRPLSVAVSPVGTGQLGDTYRLKLEFADAAPRTMICKLAASDETSRATAGHWSLYEREVRFYREVAPWARIDTPHVFGSGLSPDGGFFLLLEDMAPATPGDQIRGMDLAYADRALREIARLHAATWGKGDDPALGWLESGHLAQPFYAPDVIRGAWPGFRDRYAAMLEDEHIRVGDAFAELYDSYSRPFDRPRCVTHNDFRPDNMLYGPSPDDRLAVVDWQSAALGFNAVDVAYMIGGGFVPERRREVEGGLLAAYFDELRRQAITGYGREELRQDYRHFSFAGINVAVCAAMLVKRTERGDRMFLTMLDRHVRHVLDVDALTLLRERR